jgi:hypothetical protein
MPHRQHFMGIVSLGAEHTGRKAVILFSLQSVSATARIAFFSCRMQLCADLSPDDGRSQNATVFCSR